MSFRSALLRAVTVTGLAVSVLAAAPAHAAPTVTTDTSRPGHVVATVATEASYVRVWLEHGTRPAHWPVQVAVVDGSATVDLETWGLTDPVLAVAGCTGDAASSCGEPSRTPVTPTDVLPEVSWPDDPVIRPGETLPVTVSDPHGGGRLGLVHPCWGGIHELDRNGTTQVPIGYCGDGAKTVDLVRCQATAWQCTFPLGVSRNYRFNHVFDLDPVRINRQVASAYDDITVTAQPSDDAASYDVTWSLRGPDGEVAADTMSGLTRSRLDGTIAFPVPLTDVPSGDYHVRGTVSFTEEDGGPVTQQFVTPGFRVDADAPVVTGFALSDDAVYPNKRDNYRNTVTALGRVRDASSVTRTVEIRSATGVVVRTMRGDTWNGFDRYGEMVREGVYTFAWQLRDAAGNTTELTAPVRVSHDRVADKVFATTVGATASMLDHFAGTCSRFHAPAPGREAGTIGLHSNVSCDGRTWERSAVGSVHGVRLPAALSYDDVRITAVSGAAPSRRGSRGVLEYWSSVDAGWRHGAQVGDRFGPHAGRTVAADNLLYDRRRIAWRIFTAYDARYDVRAFKIRLYYRKLV